MTDRHDQLKGSGRNTHHQIDLYLPSSGEKSILRDIAASAPADISGARDDPEAALANLLATLESLGLITDSTTAT